MKRDAFVLILLSIVFSSQIIPFTLYFAGIDVDVIFVLLPIGGVMGIIFGFKAKRTIKQKKLISYKTWGTNEGILFLFGLLFVSSIFLGGIIFQHIDFHPQERQADARAKSAGRNAMLAEKLFFEEQIHGIKNETYVADLGKLLEIDPELTKDPEVTFVFLHASTSGFTLYTQNNNGTGKKFTYHN